MFDDRVYKRGALTLHALRTRIGDDSFFVLLRSWVDRYRGASATTKDFIALAEEISGAALGSLFDAWLRGRSLPKI